MNKIRTIIVDDESSAIDTLRGILNTFCPQVEIVASATTIEDALIAIRHAQPDLLLLDIELPPFHKGFDLLKLIPDRSFGVIFTTAYADYAIQAINDVQPWGYVVKPYRVADLVQIMQVADKKLFSPAGKEKHEFNPKNQGIIIPDSRKGNIVLHAKDIIYCRADGATTDIFYFQNDKIEKITASFTLKEVENQLSPDIFCRTHHSFLVNLQAIVRYQKTGRNGVIFLPQGHQASISVLKMDVFEQQFRDLLQ